jgi:hypothetical protein
VKLDAVFRGRVRGAIFHRFGRYDVDPREIAAIPECEWIRQRGVGRKILWQLREICADAGVDMAPCSHLVHGVTAPQLRPDR